MSINNYYNYEISYLCKRKKKSRKNYLILNFLAHCTSYQSIYGDES